MTDPDINYTPVDTVADIMSGEVWTYRDAHCRVYYLEEPEHSEEATYLGSYIYDKPDTDTTPNEEIYYKLSGHDFESTRLRRPDQSGVIRTTRTR